MLIIKHSNGNVYDLDRLGIRTRDFIISSPEIINTSEQVDGMQGLINTETNYGVRELFGSFRIKSDEIGLFSKKREEVFRIFSGLEEFILIDKYNPAKRWKAKGDGSFRPERISTFGYFEVRFISHSPFSESVNIISRSHNQNEFIFRNQGDIPVNMRHQDETEIIFKGESDNLSIKNVTTGDDWIYEGTTTSYDTITLKGIRSLKNGQSIFGQTNKKLISFNVGINRFEITGNVGAFEMSIRTRFYFL